MNKDITFCAYRGCPNIECARFYRNAPRDSTCSWFAIRPRDDGTCDCYIVNERRSLIDES